MKTALIIGSEGQDGRILYDQLANGGMQVIGVGRATVRSTFSSAAEPIDLLKPDQVDELIAQATPDEIYYLAAHHHSSSQDRGDTRSLYIKSAQVHVEGLLNVLEAMRSRAPACRLFYAGSSRLFGNAQITPQNESTPFRPTCVYGITKLAGVELCRLYRADHGLFAAVGILYNHESPLRGTNFVSQRIVRGAVAIAAGEASELVLGDLAARVDWGYAPDYTNAMSRILSLDAGRDFVMATGESHSVEEFASLAFAELGLDYRRYVRQDPNLMRRPRLDLVGDSSALRSATGWAPSISFAEMVKVLVRAAAGDRHS